MFASVQPSLLAQFERQVVHHGADVSQESREVVGGLATRDEG